MPEYAYISVVQWPERFTRQDCTVAVVDATGMDPFHADQRVAKGTPVVIQRMEVGGPAEAAVARLRTHGAMVFAPTESVMASVPPPIRLKRIEKAMGAPKPMFMAELWPAGRQALRGGRDGETHRGIIAEEMLLIIRARVRQGSSVTNIDVTPNPLYHNAYGVGFDLETSVTRESTISVRDVMDIYLRDGTRYRIDGSKFNFDGLGKDRGYSDNVNADKVAVMLAESNRRAMVDTDFGSFNCPEGLVRGAGGRERWMNSTGVLKRDDMPLFEFYSIWAYLMYRRLMKG